MSVKPDANAPDGFLVELFNGGDPLAAKDYIRARLGLPAWQPNGRGNGHARQAATSDLSAAERTRIANERVAARLSKLDAPEVPHVVATYDYRDADGTLLYVVERLEPKTFRQRAADGSYRLDGVKRVPFRLPEMLADGTAVVHLAEGEKDCLRLASLNLCSTTISGGTRWTAEIAEYFRGRDVVILQDHDAAGVKRALEAAGVLHQAAKGVRVVFLPDLTGEPGDNDISDWLDRDATRADKLADILRAAPLWRPGVEVEGQALAAAVKAKVDQPQAIDDEPLGEWDASTDFGPIPPRAWLLGNIFCRRFVSALIAPGGAGKTALRLAQLLSLAIGRGLTGEHVFQRCRVLIVSLEDDTDELRRRLRAACLHHGVEQAELKGWLFMAAPGLAGGKIMTLDEHGRPITGALIRKLTKVILDRRIDIIALDPFVKTHTLNENDNSLIDGVVQALAGLATEHDIAIDTPHHVSKGPSDPGNADRGRGASSAKDAWRIVHTLSAMSPEEAQALGIGEADRRSLIRVDSAKVNIAPPMTEARWFRLVGVQIGNGANLYPNGDEVQTVETWSPPDAFAGVSNVTLNQILTEIDAGLPDGTKFTDAPNAIDRAAWRVIQKYCPGKSEAGCRQIIKSWVKSGLLSRQTYENQTTRKPASGFKVDNEKRPS